MGCDSTTKTKECAVRISTHTSRVGCDKPEPILPDDLEISTHTSRVGCDIGWRMRILGDGFLLTHPVWDVTAIYSILQSQHPHISRDGLIIHLELY